METLFIICGILTIIYYFIIVVYAGHTTHFSQIWILAAIIFLLLGFSPHLVSLLSIHYQFSSSFIQILGILTALCLILFLSIIFMILHGMHSNAQKGLDYIILLGAQVKKTVPSKALLLRIETAANYLKGNPNTLAILSGGQGPGEEQTEAKTMSIYLIAHGISRDRLILEDQSVNTEENLRFSKSKMPLGEHKVAVVSSNFHLFRAKALARKMGFPDIQGIAAPSDLIMQPHYIIREAFAIIKEKLTGAI